ncbi:MAG TPA: pantoate--beta-alanine ligase, partial [Limnochordia bacterium]
VVSIFVNPLQFGPHEDYDRYPRTLAADRALCVAEGVDLIFAPSVAEMYPDGVPMATYVEVGGLAERLEGASRPGFFRGVATVVAKLFHIVQPDVAYFGEKDAQQLAVIRRMVRDLNLPLVVRAVPTVREPDGLAMSSRNQYLSAEERAAARVLSRALAAATRLVKRGERAAGTLEAAMREIIDQEPLAVLDYAVVADPETFAPVERLDGPALALLAVRIGGTRLIDNVRLDPADGVPAEE